jgi:DivIVA protein.
MMQPVDVRTTNFGKGLFGYKKVDVDTYVETVYRAYDEAYNELEKLREENAKLNKVIEENRVKIFELENQAKATAESPKKASSAASPKKETAAKADSKNESEASKFFNKQSDDETQVFGGDDDEVFVGEIEESRKPNKVMIGDGEEEGADDFEFL